MFFLSAGGAGAAAADDDASGKAVGEAVPCTGVAGAGVDAFFLFFLALLLRRGGMIIGVVFCV